MSYKKSFFSIMVVAIAAILYVGLTACSKDKDDVVADASYLIRYKWVNVLNHDTGHYDLHYGLEFKYYGTYSYITPSESVAGNYRIIEFQKSTGVINYTGLDGNEHEREYDGALFKILASGSNNFDQMWVYHIKNDWIIVHFYSNNIIVEMPTFTNFF